MYKISNCFPFFFPFYFNVVFHLYCYYYYYYLKICQMNWNKLCWKSKKKFTQAKNPLSEKVASITIIKMYHLLTLCYTLLLFVSWKYYLLSFSFERHLESTSYVRNDVYGVGFSTKSWSFIRSSRFVIPIRYGWNFLLCFPGKNPEKVVFSQSGDRIT